MSVAGRSSAGSITGEQVRAPVRFLNWAADQASRTGWRFSLSPEQIVEAACRSTRLRDWGEAHAAEPLIRLVGSFSHEADLTPVGRHVVQRLLIRAIENRLLVRAFLERNPEAAQARLAPGWVVVGMPRTGTTLLQSLLAQVRDARSLKGWESLRPVAAPARFGWWDRRPRGARRGKRLFEWFAPALADIHPLAVDGPEECTWLMQNTLVSPVFSMFGRIPSYMDYIWNLDESAWDRAYQEYRQQLLALQAQRSTALWVLKSPVHSMSLPALLRTCPEFRVVITERDLRATVPSTCSLFATMRSIGSRCVDRAALGEEILSDLCRGGRVIDDATARWRDRTLRVAFRDLVQDKIGVVRCIHEHFGLPFDGETDRRLQEWVANDRHVASHKYALEDFGLSEARLRACFPVD